MKILIPTDYSENSLNAFYYIQEAYGNKIDDYIFLNIQNARHAGAILTIDLNSEIIAKSNVRMTEMVQRLRLKFPNINLSGLVTAGTIIDSIVEKVSELAIDCVAIGTKGESNSSNKIIGSTAIELIGYCTKPLFVIPAGARFGKLEKALLAVDFVKEPHSETFDGLLNLCYQLDLHLDVLHVKQPNADSFTEKDIPFNTEGLNYKLTESVGTNVEFSILDFVENNQIDLVTTVRSKGGFIHELFHSSLTKKLSMHSHTPLLVLV